MTSRYGKLNLENSETVNTAFKAIRQCLEQPTISIEGSLKAIELVTSNNDDRFSREFVSIMNEKALIALREIQEVVKELTRLTESNQ